MKKMLGVLTVGLVLMLCSCSGDNLIEFDDYSYSYEPYTFSYDC